MNPLLEKIQEGIVEKVEEKDMQYFLNTVKAGKKILFDPSTHQNMGLVKDPESRKDPVGTISNGVAGLGYVMYMQSKRQLPINILVNALVMLMCEVFDFAEKAYGTPVTNQIVADTTKALSAEIAHKFGVTPDHMRQAIAAGQAQAAQEPAQPSAPQPQGMLPTGGA